MIKTGRWFNCQIFVLGQKASSSILLVSVVLGLERTFRFYTDVGRLFRVKRCQFDANPIQMQTRHLFIQMLRQDVHLVLVMIATGPQLDLGQNLIGKACTASDRSGALSLPDALGVGWTLPVFACSGAG